MTEPTNQHKVTLMTDNTELYYGVYSHEQEYKFEKEKVFNGSLKLVDTID